MITRHVHFTTASLVLTLMSGPACAVGGAEVMKALNHDNDQTLEIPEVIDAATKLFSEINPDGGDTIWSVVRRPAV